MWSVNYVWSGKLLVGQTASYAEILCWSVNMFGRGISFSVARSGKWLVGES